MAFCEENSHIGFQSDEIAFTEVLIKEEQPEEAYVEGYVSFSEGNATALEKKPHVPDIPSFESEFQENEYTGSFFSKTEEREEMEPYLRGNIDSKEELQTVLQETVEIKEENAERITNSVQSLIAEPFRSRSSTDKTEVKRLGRPTPNLTIRQSFSSKKWSFNRTFNGDIYNRHTWICGCDVNNAFFCFPCLLFGGDESWTKTGLSDLNHLGDRIKKHALSAKHMKNVLQYSLFGTGNIAARLDSAHRRNIQSRNKSVRHNRYVLNILINCVRERCCGAFELALRGHDESNPGGSRGLINFSAELDGALREHLEKATVFRGTSKSIQSEILQAMFSVCQEEIAREIKEADYLSVIVDETSIIASRCQLAIVFRYIARGKPVERFWGLLTPSDHDVKTLSSVILAELEKLVEDDKGKLIAQTFDGPAVMSRSAIAVQAIVKQTYEHAAYVHCYAHQLKLIMLNAAAANTNVRIFFANLQGVCRFFSECAQRTAMLDQTVKKRSPGAAPTTWNFHLRIASIVFEYREDMIETMRRILSQSKNAGITTINQASGYIATLTSKSFVFWLNLFYKIMPHIDSLSTIFQNGEIDHVVVNKYILSFESQLTQIRKSVTELPDTDEPSGAKRCKTDKDGYAQEVQEVCHFICQAKYRFSFTGHLIAASLFFAEKYSQYSARFPEKTLHETIKAYPFLNGQKLQTELTVIYETEGFRSVSGLLPLYDLFSQSSELSETFSETLKLLKILITIPMASAEAERCFSTLATMKTFVRSTTSQERLSTLAMLCLERDLIESIPNFNRRVIDKFATTTDRCADFLFQ